MTPTDPHALAQRLQRLADKMSMSIVVITPSMTEALQAGAQALRSHEDKDHGGTSLTEGASVSVSVPASQLPHDEPFFIEVDKNGCERCGHGKQWTVVGPDGVAIGQSFEDEELASDIADYMNRGFHAGCGGE